MTIKMKTQSALIVLCLLVPGASALAAGLAQLDDDQLSEVRGQDGINLNLNKFSFQSKAQYGIPALTLTYTMPHDDDPFFRDPTKAVSYIEHGGFYLQRSDAANPFADPYQIQIETLTVPSKVRLASQLNSDPSRTLPATMEVVHILNPKNLAGAEVWQMRHDWKVATNVGSGLTPVVHEMGQHVVEDLVIYGGGLDLAPAWSFKDGRDVVGTAFGLDINMKIGKLMLLPRGGYVKGAPNDTEMVLSGIQIGRANSTLTGVDQDKTKAWRVADVIQQPGIISAVTDSDGNSSLQIGIEWYRGSDTDAPRPESIGAVSIDNVSIKNGAGVVKDLGSMSIGGIQINYLNVNFRNK